MGTQVMHRVLAVASVVTGGGTAGGVLTHSITEATAVVGAICAVATTVGTLWLQYRNYKLNKQKEEREARRDYEDSMRTAQREYEDSNK